MVRLCLRITGPPLPERAPTGAPADHECRIVNLRPDGRQPGRLTCLTPQTLQLHVVRACWTASPAASCLNTPYPGHPAAWEHQRCCATTLLNALLTSCSGRRLRCPRRNGSPGHHHRAARDAPRRHHRRRHRVFILVFILGLVLRRLQRVLRAAVLPGVRGCACLSSAPHSESILRGRWHTCAAVPHSGGAQSALIAGWRKDHSMAWEQAGRRAQPQLLLLTDIMS
jgi:hypothetical protein